MSDLVSAAGWHLMWEAALDDAEAQDAEAVHRFTLPQVALFPSFRVLLPTWTDGDVQVSLRFGFDDSDADAATEGIDFPTLNAANASSYKTPVFSIGASAPDVEGNPNAIIPPRVSVIVTTTLGGGSEITGTYQVHAAWLQAW